MSLLESLRRTLSSSSRHAGGHMTFASRSLSQSVSTTRLFFKKRLWAWPIVAVVLLGTLGWGINRAIESTMKANLQSGLATLLTVERSMLERFLMRNERVVEAQANDSEVRAVVEQLLTDEIEAEDKRDAAALEKQLAELLHPTLTSQRYNGFMLFDREKTVRAATDRDVVGQRNVAAYDEFLTKALEGGVTVSRPFASVAAIKDESGKMRTGVPTMFAAAPVRDKNLQVIGVLGFRLRPDFEFTQMLQLGKMEDSGETYAFDRAGLLLSNSRFDNELMLLGVIQEGEHSILNVLVRDPGGNMTTGYRPKVVRSQLPLTEVVKGALASKEQISVDVEGHNDYRGVPSVAAWTWLDKYDFGLAVEIDKAEAFAPLIILKRTFWGLLGLLLASSLAIFLFTVRVTRLQREARAHAIEAKQLGQYQLEQKLGAGAMGVVYRGRHAMLRRPTAIKLLDADKVTDQSIQRFEREVQITSQLCHPNTVAIYDFGRTPEGVFYYAMEYLEGIDLQALIEQYGPQPAGRVIHMLQQICGSLYEAHSMGLVHRDIKPANLMLVTRGGESDVVKVLDFGLVRAREDAADDANSQGLAGTPLYMSPEAIQLPGSVDACSDLYAVGAVGYFLLTGHPVFEAASIVDLCNKHVAETPVAPSQRLGRPVPEDLENVILACLEKSRAKRPQTARDLAQRLARCEAAGQWTMDDADAWWSRHARGLAPVATSAPTLTSRRYEATIDH